MCFVVCAVIVVCCFIVASVLVACVCVVCVCLLMGCSVVDCLRVSMLLFVCAIARFNCLSASLYCFVSLLCLLVLYYSGVFVCLLMFGVLSCLALLLFVCSL